MTSKRELQAAWRCACDDRDEFRKERDSLAAQLQNAARKLPTDYDVRVAAEAVAMILEQHAEVMATEVGAGVAAYQRAVKRVHSLRRAVRDSSPTAPAPVTASSFAALEGEARALYNELTT